MTDAAEALRSTLVRHIEGRERSAAVNAAIAAVENGGVAIDELYDLIASMLAEVGASWRAGDVRVWEEHFVSAVARTIVEACHALVAARSGPPSGLTVILAAPPEEYHDLGLRMLADRFALAGWTAHLLGANLPVAELIAAVDGLGADAVVLSASTHFHRVALASYVEALHTARPDVRVWVGGPAFSLEHDGWPDDTVLDPGTIPTLATRIGG